MIAEHIDQGVDQGGGEASELTAMDWGRIAHSDNGGGRRAQGNGNRPGGACHPL